MDSRPLGAITFGLILALIWPQAGSAQESGRCAAPVAQVVSVQGTIERRDDQAAQWVRLELNDLVCPGESIHVAERSRAALFLLDIETVVRIDQNTTFQLAAPPEAEPSVGRFLVDLVDGAMHFFSRVPRSLEVRTPYVNAGVEGTEFLVRVVLAQASAFVVAYEGTVAGTAVGAAAGGEPLLLASGDTGVGAEGQAPRRLDPANPDDRVLWRWLVRPRDAVQWTVFYPPLFLDQADPSAPAAAVPPLLQAPLAALRAGDLDGAFERLDQVPEDDREERFYLFRAGLLLTVGRLEEARDDLSRVPETSPLLADKLSLEAVIAVALNENETALSAGQRAVEQDPGSSSAKIALSYAQQANFQLEAARDTLLQAVEDQADDGLAWARLAELWLSLGYLDEALAAAQRAAAAAPNLSRTNTVLGFAELAQVNLLAAKNAFRTALSLDSSDPLPRLGLGLAWIRGGELVEGRRQIEIAVGLNPEGAILRSYLGKAYFDETRSPLAETQLDIAKKLDPTDPTPWLYDAIVKQSENRPVEALQDLETAQSLNDNRAVYRSRLQLDEDLSVRGARLASVYRDLGFEQLALVEGWNSVNRDPGNFSAHRSLADTYAALPRHEIARDSELLQSQLLQPININPVQPRLAGNGLSFLDDSGPARVGFNEFTRLFARDEIRLTADGIIGSDDTYADNAIVSGIHENMSFSVGQFHYQTDGTRENNDLRTDIYNAFFQVDLSHKTSAQVELRKINEDFGFRPMLFHPDNIFEDSDQDFDSKSARLGVRHDFTPNSTFIGSYVYRSLEDDLDTGTGFRVQEEDDSHFFEARHLYQGSWFDVTGGGGYVHGDKEAKAAVSFFPFFTFKSSEDLNIDHWNGYVYSYIDLPKDAILTLGVSGDTFDNDVFNRDQVNPKAGLVWNILPSTTLRAAAFRTLKRTLTSSQTIEPTQVAGFNQFFDDINGTDAWRYGAGLDQKIDLDPTQPGAEIYAGVEGSKRDLEVPTIFVSDQRVEDVDWDEWFARAYIYWTPLDWLVLNAEYQFEYFDRDSEGNNDDALSNSRTHKFPLEARMFLPSGLFARARATYVDQDGDFQDASFNVVSEHDNFWTIDAALGYRLPNQLGVASLEVRNLFDEDYRHQASDPTDPLILPERTIFARLTLTF